MCGNYYTFLLKKFLLLLILLLLLLLLLLFLSHPKFLKGSVYLLFANIVQGQTEMNNNIVKSAYENIYLDYCSIITIYIVVISIELQNAVTTHFV